MESALKKSVITGKYVEILTIKAISHLLYSSLSSSVTFFFLVKKEKQEQPEALMHDWHYNLADVTETCGITCLAEYYYKRRDR